MVKRPAPTFFCKADGDSMTGAGIHTPGGTSPRYPSLGVRPGTQRPLRHPSQGVDRHHPIGRRLRPELGPARRHRRHQEINQQAWASRRRPTANWLLFAPARWLRFFRR